MRNSSSDQCGCCANEVSETLLPQGVVSAGYCPRSKSKGIRVDGATVKALLGVSLTELREESYFFCKAPDCPVVYFSEDGTQTFTTDQIRERVYQKEPNSASVFICYCFRHTPESIRTEITSTGKSTVVEAINAGIQAGQCACDIRNPQGSCCLGNVSTYLKQLRQTTIFSEDSL